MSESKKHIERRRRVLESIAKRANIDDKVIAAMNRVPRQLFIEKRLEQILGGMEGITSVDVMITLSATSEKVLEKSIQLEENKQEIEKGSGESLEKSVTSSLSKKNEALLTGNTSGSMPYIIKEMSPSIQGVVVAAQGNITQTKIREISEAVQALFGIEAHKIKVIEKKSQAEEAK